MRTPGGNTARESSSRCGHQGVSRRLANLLENAAPPRLVVVEAVGVRLLDNTMFIPDVLVVARDIGLANRSGILAAADVDLVVEIVSPGSKTTDRVTKPAVYAQEGIASFWHVEPENGPVIFAYRLEKGRYVESGSARPGERLVLDEPFAVSIDPGELRPCLSALHLSLYRQRRWRQAMVTPSGRGAFR